MRRVFMTALAAAATIAIASPASAAVSLTDTNGTPLDNQIFGDPGTDAIHVFGSAPSNNNSGNVEYTGNTLLHITNGFAQIQDSPNDGDGNLFDIIINPDDVFNAMKFSTQLEGIAGTVTVYFLLTGGGFDANSIASYTSCGNPLYCGIAGTYTSGQNDNLNHLLSGGNFDGMMVQSDVGISLFQLKQNSYNLVGVAVPEPATWAMMLLGFAGIGMALRRNRRKVGALMQIA